MTVPDFPSVRHNRNFAALAKRCEEVPTLGMFRIADSKFLLVYAGRLPLSVVRRKEDSADQKCRRTQISLSMLVATENPSKDPSSNGNQSRNKSRSAFLISVSSPFGPITFWSLKLTDGLVPPFSRDFADDH